MDSSKWSIALLEASCALGFVACGVVLGFCFGGLLGPLLVNPDVQSVAALRGSAAVGTLFGAAAAVAAYFRLSRARRQWLATNALALAAVTAFFTAVVVQRFATW